MLYFRHKSDQVSLESPRRAGCSGLLTQTTYIKKGNKMTKLQEQLAILERDSDIDFQFRLIGNYLKRASQHIADAYDLGMYYNNTESQILELMWNVDAVISKLEILKRA